MAAGRPIVATAVGGSVSLIEDGISGLLVTLDDPQCLGEAILRLLSEPALSARLGRARARNAYLNDSAPKPTCERSSVCTVD